MKTLGGEMGHLGGAPEESLTGKTRKQSNKERIDLKLL
jgi:hypothetical protein